jgi:hypothetical protein
MELTAQEIAEVMGYVIMFILGVAVGFVVAINTD